MIRILLIILSTPIDPEPDIPQHPCPTAVLMGRRLGAADDLYRNACAAESALRDAGWSDAWVAGALTNGWFESGWDPGAVGDRGRSVGFWQLRDDGLGRGMGDLRFDLHHSTRAIISSAQRQKIRTDVGDVSHATDSFCQLIMRPSDSVRKGELRARWGAHLTDEGE